MFFLASDCIWISILILDTFFCLVTDQCLYRNSHFEFYHAEKYFRTAMHSLKFITLQIITIILNNLQLFHEYKLCSQKFSKVSQTIFLRAVFLALDFSILWNNLDCLKLQNIYKYLRRFSKTSHFLLRNVYCEQFKTFWDLSKLFQAILNKFSQRIIQNILK